MGLTIYGLIQLLFLGAFMVSCCALGVLLIKRIRQAEGETVEEGKIRTLSSMNIGNRRKLMLLEIEKQNFLIGVTEYKIETLHTFDKDKAKKKKPVGVEASKEKAFKGVGQFTQTILGRASSVAAPQKISETA